MAELAMSPAVLAEMVALIEGGIISGKIAKQILPDLLKVPPSLREGLDLLFFYTPWTMGVCGALYGYVVGVRGAVT